MVDYKGAIHIHTDYSDGTGKLSHIVNEALKSGLDFIIITDHNTIRHKVEGHEGWYENKSAPKNKLLVLVGEEITPRHNHLLAIGIERRVKPAKDPLKYIKEVNSQGGAGFILHPSSEWKMSLPMIKGKGWRNWQKNGCSGLELWSYMFDWVSSVNILNLPYYLLHPERAITGPEDKALKTWDELCQNSQTVAIGGVDAHARNILPFGILQLFPYRMLFRTIRTHILVDNWENDLEKDSQKVYSALRKGYCYISYDWLNPADGFQFLAMSEKDEWMMGDIIPQSSLADGEVKLIVKSPQYALLRLIRNGYTLRESYHNELKFKVKEPGVYRIEAHLKGKPWVYTNPIYIKQNQKGDSYD